ncbi:zeta toxin family protein [Marinomonas sp. A79]|uniref:Zeta toxin family protein n=1 Tax=Marinomonas vulgaris TaxID=2823372 RepID=A0ABS5H7D8_9GAMM|nr:zeta toxin family protein [Marinomonas vulgaris]MBR7887618.1 zeta toxin family protein [Marinomonas vulgaris]
MPKVTESDIKNTAVIYAKSIKKAFAKKVVDPLSPEEKPVSVFMAGSPGAGKTEVARLIIRDFEDEYGVNLVHIENDELRKEFAGYDGHNSPLFQKPATILVEAIHDRALSRSISFVLDSTLASFEKAQKNIERSLAKGRYIQIIFVYQEPEQAWELVKAREKVEGRRVPPEVFVEQFMGSQHVVSKLKHLFNDEINIIFMEKNIYKKDKNEKPKFNVADIDVILRKKYNREQLEAIVGLR